MTQPNRVLAASNDELAAEEVLQKQADQLFVQLATTAAGLGTGEAQARLAAYGPNSAATVKRSLLGSRAATLGG